MVHFQLISCKIKFQLCVGHFPDGRMRTRTFGIGGVRADVSADDVAAVARAIAPLLAYPVVQVRLVRKYLLVRGGAARVASLQPTLYIPESSRRMNFSNIISSDSKGDICYGAWEKSDKDDKNISAASILRAAAGGARFGGVGGDAHDHEGGGYDDRPARGARRRRHDRRHRRPVGTGGVYKLQ